MTTDTTAIIPMLRSTLEEKTTIQQRRLKVNQQDEDEDLLAYFKWTAANTVLFGMIMRIIPAEIGGVLPKDFSERQLINIGDLDVGEANQSQYKSCYYFATNGEYLITDLSQNTSIIRLQTYINWLIENQRGNILFTYAPLMVMPQGVQLKDIKQVEFSGTPIRPIQNANDNSISSRLVSIKHELLTLLVGDTPSLASLQNEQLVSAQVIVKFKKKPKEMSKEEYQHVMSAIAKNVTTDSGYAIKTKNGNLYNGEQICKTKEVEIEKDSQNHLNEEQLSQEMERFLLEIQQSNE